MMGSRRFWILTGLLALGCGKTVIGFSLDDGGFEAASDTMAGAGVTVTGPGTGASSVTSGSGGSSLSSAASTGGPVPITVVTGPATTGGFAGGSAAGGSGGATSDGGSPPGKAVSYCSPPYAEPVPATSALLSDFEGNTGLLLQTLMPGGIWAMDTDGTGTNSMNVEPCGTTGNGLRFQGRDHRLWGADVAAALVSQVQPVDTSAYRGLSFVMRSAVPTLVFVKVQVPYSQPACGQCDDSGAAGNECFSGYSVFRVTTTDNQPQVVLWEDLTQQSWGYRAPGSAQLDPGNLVSVAFAFDVTLNFDVCLDDVKLVP